MKTSTNNQIPFTRFMEVMDLIRAHTNEQAIPNTMNDQGAASVCAAAMISSASTALILLDDDNGKAMGVLIGAIAKNPIENVMTAHAQLVFAQCDLKSVAYKALADAFAAWAKEQKANEVFVLTPCDVDVEGYQRTQSVFGKKLEA